MRNEQAVAYNDRNVYILGAGFSVEAGLPVIRDFMNRMRDAAACLAGCEGSTEEVEAIARVLEYRLKAAAAAYRIPVDIENIEELFSLASASESELANDVTLAIAATIDVCSEMAKNRKGGIHIAKRNEDGWKLPSNWRRTGGKNQWMKANVPNAPTAVFSHQSDLYECPAYEFYVGLMCGYFDPKRNTSTKTIISLNYDTVVEDALLGLGLPFRYPDNGDITWQHPLQAPSEGVQILKLHGSVNISSKLEDWLKGVDTSEWTAKDKESLDTHVDVYASYHELRMNDATPSLVPPTWQKSLTGYLSTVWRNAVNALKSATRIILIGYSVPPTDQHFRYLLAAGLQDNISLRKVFFVNPIFGQGSEGQELERRLLSLFRDQHIKQGLVEPVALTLKEFLAAPDSRESYRQRIGRTVNPIDFKAESDEAPWHAYVPNAGSVNY